MEVKWILDTSLIANETIDYIRRKNGSGIMCKLDIEKAYDHHVNWNFLGFVLKQMSFGEKWKRWIEWCKSIASFSIIVNGSPTGFFRYTRGLRQVELLSPYLFILVMEALNWMTKKVTLSGYLKGWYIDSRRNEGKVVTHL